MNKNTRNGKKRCTLAGLGLVWITRRCAKVFKSNVNDESSGKQIRQATNDTPQDGSNDLNDMIWLWEKRPRPI